MLLTTLTTAPFLIKGSSSPACSKKYMRKCQVTYWLIDWIGFNGHSTAMVILGRPREREGYIGNPLSNFYGSLTCQEERPWYTGPPGKRPHPTDAAREKCLAKGHSQYTTVAPPPRLETGTPYLQSSALSTTLPGPPRLLIEGRWFYSVLIILMMENWESH